MKRSSAASDADTKNNKKCRGLPLASMACRRDCGQQDVNTRLGVLKKPRQLQGADAVHKQNSRPQPTTREVVARKRFYERVCTHTTGPDGGMAICESASLQALGRLSYPGRSRSLLKTAVLGARADKAEVLAARQANAETWVNIEFVTVGYPVWRRPAKEMRRPGC